MRVLIVENDATAAAEVELILKRESMVCDIAQLGEDALDLGKRYDYDVILLELRLSDIDGYEVLRRLRAACVETPVFVLSGLDKVEDKVRALGFGADDYLTKPFDSRELVARLKAIVRRSKGFSENVIRTGRLELNLNRRVFSIDGKPVHVTLKEYGILELLSLRKRAGIIVSKEMVLDHLYGGVDEPELRVIDVFVCKLRRIIARETGNPDTAAYIHTVWGRGYRLNDPDTALNKSCLAASSEAA